MPDAGEYGDAGTDTLGNAEPRRGGPVAPDAGPDGARQRRPHPGRAPGGASGRLLGANGRALAGQGHHHRPLGDDGRLARRAAAALPAGLPAGGDRPLDRRDRRAGRARQPGRERHRRSSRSWARSTSAPASPSSTPRPTRSSRWRRTRRRCRSRPSTPGAGRPGASSIRSGWPASSPGRSWAGRAPTSAPTTARTSRSLPPRQTVLEMVAAAGVPVVGVGKIGDIFDRRGISEDVHTEGNADGLRRTGEILDRMERGLLFVNLVDFDMLWGHRNDARGYARALEELDRGAARRPGEAAGGGPARPHRRPRLRPDHARPPTTPASTFHSWRARRGGTGCRSAPGRPSPTWGRPWPSTSVSGSRRGEELPRRGPRALKVEPVPG